MAPAIVMPAPAVAARLPPALHLAGLGTVLCLYRPHQGGELAGWRHAHLAVVQRGVDSDGLRERLLFLDAEGRPCWQLHLLPETDFLAWERLAASLPCDPIPDEHAGVAERLWRHLARRLSGERWRACALHLHALPWRPGGTMLAAAPAMLSPLAAAAAEDIARGERAELAPWDDCCCALASRRADALAAAGRDAGAEVSLRLAAKPRA
ncbi:MAG: Hemin transport protein [Pseudoxanthomonas sp.]